MMGPLEATNGGTAVCQGHPEKIPAVIADVKQQTDNPGLNPYVLQRLIDLTMDGQHDPHSALKGNSTPAILLKGECDFVPWKAALDYRQTFANLNIYYIPKSGHYIQFEQPELMTNVIRNFLLDQPAAIPPYISDADPRPPAN